MDSVPWEKRILKQHCPGNLKNIKTIRLRVSQDSVKDFTGDE